MILNVSTTPSLLTQVTRFPPTPRPINLPFILRQRLRKQYIFGAQTYFPVVSEYEACAQLYLCSAGSSTIHTNNVDITSRIRESAATIYIVQSRYL